MENEMPDQKKKSFIKNFGKNPWVFTTLILGILSLVLILGNFIGSSTANIVSENVAAKNLVSYLNTVSDSEISLIDVTDEGNMYLVTVDYKGEDVPIYVTKDGGYYAPNLIPLDEDVNAGPNAGSSQPRQTNPSNSERVDIGVDDDAVKGDSNAPVTIIEFSDYECPFCTRFYSETLGQIEKEYIDTGKVKFVYRDFPLSFHKNAQKAAEAAECARDVGGSDEKYYTMHDKLFEEGVDGGVSAFKQYAKDLGLNSQKFDECLDSGKYYDEVQKDFDDGQAAGISGTPGFFINGKPLSGAQPFSAFQQIIEQELSK